MASVHGKHHEGTWLVYSRHDLGRLSGLPEVSFGPFLDRSEVESFMQNLTHQDHLVAVNMSDFPDWFGAGTEGQW